MAKPIELDDNMPEYNDPNRGTSMVEGVDLANLPGHKKMQLIKSGDLSIDQFVTPPNMPGRKLAELRKQHRESVQQVMLDAEPKEEDNPYKPGDFVVYKSQSCEVLAVDGTKVVIMDMERDKKIKVSYAKVTKG